jgi:oxygen-dependent protoporphyrinogen oxidase
MLGESVMKRTVIVGGGITGLATAFYLQELSHGEAEITLIESTPRWGGKITSAHERGFVVEGGPDSFMTQKGAALELCHRLGLDDQLVSPNHTEHTTYVWSRGELHPMPEGMILMAPTMILPFLRSRLISWPGKLRMGMEMLIPAKGKDDESLASFVRRRLGAEALEKIAAPLMAGIYAADPETLSLQSTFPLISEMENKYGSLLRGMIMQKRAQKRVHGKRGPATMTLRGGLQQLIDAIRARLNSQQILLNCRALTVTVTGDRYEIALNDGSRIHADEVVFATPAYVTAGLVQEIDPVLASELREIRYVSTATVSLGFRLSDVERPLNGFGFVVPHVEKRRITACSWSSAKFKHRAPSDCVLMRVFLGGAHAESVAEKDEAVLVQLARQELHATMGIVAKPVLAKAYRWHKANPQYEVGHQRRIAGIDRIIASHPGLHLAGAAYHGSGIPDCIYSGAKVAKAITNYAGWNGDGIYDTLPAC